MFHNFTFLPSSGGLIFFKVNPTDVVLNNKNRNTIKPLDGPRTLFYMDSTGVSGDLIWGSIPIAINRMYSFISDLENSDGTLFFNKMPNVATYKNLFSSSHIDYNEGNIYWGISPGGQVISPVTTLTFNKKRHANAYINGAGSAVSSYLKHKDTNIMASYHNMFSVFGKNLNTDKICLQLYSPITDASYSGIFDVVGDTFSYSASSSELPGGVIKYSNNWSRMYVYFDAMKHSELGNSLIPVIYIDYNWSLAVSRGLYLDGAQFEQDTNKVTWFYDTYGNALIHPYTIKFGTKILDYKNTSGNPTVDIRLPFILTGSWL